MVYYCRGVCVCVCVCVDFGGVRACLCVYFCVVSHVVFCCVCVGGGVWGKEGCEGQDSVLYVHLF